MIPTKAKKKVINRDLKNDVILLSLYMRVWVKKANSKIMVTNIMFEKSSLISHKGAALK